MNTNETTPPGSQQQMGMPRELEDDYERGLDDDDDDTCGMCGGDGMIMLSEAGPSEWGEDCFCEVDRPIACPECRERARYEAFRKQQEAQRHTDGTQRPGDAEATNATRATPPGSLE